MKNIFFNAKSKFTALTLALTAATLGGEQRADAATMNVYDGSFSNECKPFATGYDKPENTCIRFEFKDLPSGTLDLRAELPVIDGITSPQSFVWYNPEDDSTSNSFITIGDEFTFLTPLGGDSNIKNNSPYGTVAITHGNSGAINSGSDLFTGEPSGYIELNGERRNLDINLNFENSTSVPAPSTLLLLLGGLGIISAAGQHRTKRFKHE